jgi:hypothetical protein
MEDQPAVERVQGFRGGRPGPLLTSAVGDLDTSAGLSGIRRNLEACDGVSVRSTDLGDEALLALSEEAGPPQLQHALVVVRDGDLVGVVRHTGYPRADEQRATELAETLATRLARIAP